MTKNDLANFIVNQIMRDKIERFSLFNNKAKGIFAILSILHETEEELTSGDVAKKLRISTARMAVAVKTLLKKGYVKKEKSKIDKRRLVITITEEGIKLYEREKRNILAFIEKIFAVLSDEEVDSLGQIAKKLLSSC